MGRWVKVLPSLSAVAVGAVVGAVACAALGALSGTVPGVVLSGAEQQLVLAALALVGGVSGAITAVILGQQPRLVRATFAGLVPALGLIGLAFAPRAGRIVVQVQDEFVIGILVMMVVASAALRTRVWWLVGAGLALALAGGAHRLQSLDALPPPTPAAVGPDIVVVTLDTTRADVLAAWGADGAAPTPALDALAARGRVFERAFSPVALTGPAHAVLWSGDTGVLDVVQVNGESVPESVAWLPEQLRAAGWRTMAFASAAVLDASLGYCRGFSQCDTTAERRLVRGHRLLSWRGWRSRAGMAWSRDDRHTVDLALEAWQGRGAGPTLLWVHLYGPHWPYAPSAAAAAEAGLVDDTPLVARGLPGIGSDDWSAAERARGGALYRAQMVDVDAQLARLLAAVKDDPIVVVVGDHGESLGEHGSTFAHGRLAFAPDTQVPLLVAGPGVEPGVERGLVALSDVAPTVASLAGLSTGAPLLNPEPDATVVSRAWGRSQPGGDLDLGSLAGIAVRRGDRTVAASRWHPIAAYDRTDDPAETRPLALQPDDAPLVERLLAEVASAAPAGTPDPEMDSALEALGYREPISPAAGPPRAVP